MIINDANSRLYILRELDFNFPRFKAEVCKKHSVKFLGLLLGMKLNYKCEELYHVMVGAFVRILLRKKMGDD